MQDHKFRITPSSPFAVHLDRQTHASYQDGFASAYQSCELERARSIRRQAELHAIHTVSTTSLRMPADSVSRSRTDHPSSTSPAHTMFFRCDGQHGCRAGRTECDLVMSSNAGRRSQKPTYYATSLSIRRTADWMKPWNANGAECSCGAKQSHEWPHHICYRTNTAICGVRAQARH